MWSHTAALHFASRSQISTRDTIDLDTTSVITIRPQVRSIYGAVQEIAKRKPDAGPAVLVSAAIRKAGRALSAGLLKNPPWTVVYVAAAFTFSLAASLGRYR